MKKNQQNGVELIGNSEPTFLYNSIEENSIGIVISDSSNPKFGNSLGGGGNLIANNTLCDFRHTGVTDISTVGTEWDADIFEFTITNNCSGGANIVVDGAGSVDYQYIPPTNLPLLQSQLRIRVDHPMFGELIFTQLPQFLWASTGRMTMVAVWKQPPVVGSGEIPNAENISWIWHSGFGTGSNGLIQFEDGRSLKSADITDTLPPQQLEKGRSYYWAVWEWDAYGNKIYASSALHYFRISN